MMFLAMFLPLVLTQQTTSSGSQPIFTHTPLNVTQVIGRNVTLDCRVDSLGSRKVTWSQVCAKFKYNYGFKLASMSSFLLIFDVQKYILIVIYF